LIALGAFDATATGTGNAGGCSGIIGATTAGIHFEMSGLEAAFSTFSDAVGGCEGVEVRGDDGDGADVPGMTALGDGASLFASDSCGISVPGVSTGLALADAASEKVDGADTGATPVAGAPDDRCDCADLLFLDPFLTVVTFASVSATRRALIASAAKANSRVSCGVHMYSANHLLSSIMDTRCPPFATCRNT
jgi:hypothetical protein